MRPFSGNGSAKSGGKPLAQPPPCPPGPASGGSAKRLRESITRDLNDCWKNSPTIGSALRAPGPHELPIVMRLSLKPTHAPATSCGCIKMNQPSVLSCVVPVLPATSA